MSGIGDEADERDPGRDAEGVAPTRVVVRPLAEQHDGDADRDDEVQRPVVVVARDDERLEVQRPSLERRLVEDAEDVLEVDDGCALRNATDGWPSLAFRPAE